MKYTPIVGHNAYLYLLLNQKEYFYEENQKDISDSYRKG